MFSAKGIKKLSATARHPFTVEEDAKLLDIMTSLQVVNWEQVASHFNGRTSRQCRERWLNYLNPSIRSGPWTEYEDDLLLEKVNELGRCWSSIGKYFNGRSENDIKNRWYSHLRYRTVENDGHFKFINDPSESLFPYRKTRKRVKISPQQNAIRVLEQQRRKQIVENNIPQMAMMPIRPMQPMMISAQESQPFFHPAFPFLQQFQPQQFRPIQVQPMQFQKQQTVNQKQPKKMSHSQSQFIFPPTQVLNNQPQKSQSKKQKESSTQSSEMQQSADENFKEEDLFLSNMDEIQQDIPEPEFVDFWEPHIFDEAMTSEFSAISQTELNAYSQY